MFRSSWRYIVWCELILSIRFKYPQFFWKQMICLSFRKHHSIIWYFLSLKKFLSFQNTIYFLVLIVIISLIFYEVLLYFWKVLHFYFWRIFLNFRINICNFVYYIYFWFIDFYFKLTLLRYVLYVEWSSIFLIIW